MASNADLNAAGKAKKDEFYTQLVDIEKELKYYKPYFKDKVVLCNCDDPYESNFFKYFALNFNLLGLKKLIATCYNGSPIAGDELPLLFELPDAGEDDCVPKKIAYKVEISEVEDYNGDGAVNLADVAYLLNNDKNVISILKGNGDFRSAECIELLKQADIVVTNPPFSLFREYVAQLIEYQKLFLIIGNVNAVTYKECFKLIQDNKMWMGASIHSGDSEFRVPDDSITTKSVTPLLTPSHRTFRSTSCIGRSGILRARTTALQDTKLLTASNVPSPSASMSTATSLTYSAISAT